MVALYGGSHISQSRGIGIVITIEKLEFKESSVVEVCSKNSTEGSTGGSTWVVGVSARGKRAESMERWC